MNEYPRDIDDLNDRFKWTADGKVDSWRVLQGQGKLRGDCDDYALTALFIHCDYSWFILWWRVLTFQSMIWLTRTKGGELHAMLWHRGRGWIDNTNPEWGERKLKRIMPFILPAMVIKVLIGKFFA